MKARGRALAAAILITAAASIAQAQTAADPMADAGGAAFQNELGCGSCHFKDSTFAPPLEGIVGRKIAAVPGFLYSAALKAKGGAWTDARLDAFLASPQDFAPGSGMDARVEDPAKRRQVIAYLKTLK